MNTRVYGWIASALGAIAAIGFTVAIVDTTLARDRSDRRHHDVYERVEYGPADRPDTAMSMEALAAGLREQGYDRIREIEREHGHYEVKAHDRNGSPVELYVDAYDGRVLKAEHDD